MIKMLNFANTNLFGAQELFYCSGLPKFDIFGLKWHFQRFQPFSKFYFSACTTLVIMQLCHLWCNIWIVTKKRNKKYQIYFVRDSLNKTQKLSTTWRDGHQSRWNFYFFAVVDLVVVLVVDFVVVPPEPLEPPPDVSMLIRLWRPLMRTASPM